MQSPPQIGPWTVSSPCRPGNVLPDLGFCLDCGGVLVNVGPRPVELWASVEPDVQPNPNAPPAASPLVPGPVSGLVQPKRSVTLGAPPAGYHWSVGWVTRRSAREWAIVIVGAAALVSGLAGLGVADIIRMVRERRKRARRR